METSIVEPDLRIGTTLAIFNSSGKILCENDSFIKNNNGLIIKCAHFFRIEAGMSSQPELLFFKEFITDITSY